MKYIPKYAGGGFAFVSYTDIDQPYPSAAETASFGESTTTTASGSSSSSKSSDSDDDSLKQDSKFYEKLLPNDAKEVIGMYNVLDLMKAFGNTRAVSRILREIQEKIAEGVVNKSSWTNATAAARSNNRLSEYAVDADGTVFVMGSEGLKKKQVTSVEKGERILTNGLLLLLRAYYPKMRFDNGEISRVVDNGVSMREVVAQINDIASHIGKNDIARDAYVSKESANKLLLGLGQLIQEGAEGVYKIHTEKSEQGTSAQYTLNYIYHTLPNNMVTLLMAYALQRGLDPVKGTLQIIQEAIQGRLDTTDKMLTSYDTNATKGVKDDSGSGSSTDLAKMKLSAPMQFLAGYGTEETILMRNGSKGTLIITGNTGVLTKKDGTALSMVSLTQVANSSYAGIFDLQNATFGGLKINAAQRNSIIVDGNKVLSADLPVKSDGTPDLDALKKMDLVKKIIRLKGITDINTINQIYTLNGLPMKYVGTDAQGNPILNLTKYKRFAILLGAADGSALPDGGKLSNGVIPLEDPNEANHIVSILLGSNKKYSVPTRGFFWNSEPDLYKGMVFIPLRTNMFMAMQGSGVNPTAGQSISVHEAEYAKDHRPTKVPTKFNITY